MNILLTLFMSLCIFGALYVGNVFGLDDSHTMSEIIEKKIIYEVLSWNNDERDELQFSHLVRSPLE